MRSSIWSRTNSRISHQVAVEVVVSREAITEDEETEEGVGQEELVEEEEAGVESLKCAGLAQKYRHST